MDRIILHSDLNSFFASVECIYTPALRDVPMAVAGSVENRHGIIVAKNELAKKCGVKTAETIWQAKKKCPELVLVPPRHGEYERYSQLVSDIYGEFTDLIEPFGIDESWLDVTGVGHLFGDGPTIANRIRRTVRERLGLTVSIGVSFNKAFAKLGSDYKKPDATTVITRENYKEVVWPLPVGDLLYVGKAAHETLTKMYITTIGRLAMSDRDNIVRSLGKMGGLIHDYANGIDNSPVKSIEFERDAKSVGNGMTFDHDLVGYDEIKGGVLALASEVASRMRRYNKKCSVVSVTIKNPHLQSISRQKTLRTPTYLTKELIDVSMDIIRASWSNVAPIRALTITAGNLIDVDATGEQLSLFGTEDEFDKGKQEQLDKAVDQIRERYGGASIGLGALVKKPISTEE